MHWSRIKTALSFVAGISLSSAASVMCFASTVTDLTEDKQLLHEVGKHEVGWQCRDLKEWEWRFQRSSRDKKRVEPPDSIGRCCFDDTWKHEYPVSSNDELPRSKYELPRLINLMAWNNADCAYAQADA